MPEIVGDAGLVVGKRDPEGLAAAVNAVIHSDALAASLGLKARRRAEERYSMNHWLDHLIAAYEHLRPGLTRSGKAAA
jgi:glycosyltransferase involved in cell wall biosynthesis